MALQKDAGRREHVWRGIERRVAKGEPNRDPKAVRRERIRSAPGGRGAGGAVTAQPGAVAGRRERSGRRDRRRGRGLAGKAWPR